MTARALLDREPHPDEQRIREAISGQICRCTGYTTIVRSIQWAAEHPEGPTPEPAAPETASESASETASETAGSAS